MLGLIERFRSGPKPKERQPRTIALGQLQIEINPEKFNSLIHVPNGHRHALETAEEHGVKPLTFDQAISQIDETLRQNVVLFDTSPANGLPGNHYRLVTDETGQTKLQFCNAFGSYDNRGLLPFSPPEDYAMFTGATVHMYKKDDKLLTMEEAQGTFLQAEKADIPSGINHTVKLTLWSNEEGKLVAISGNGIQIPLAI